MFLTNVAQERRSLANSHVLSKIKHAGRKEYGHLANRVIGEKNGNYLQQQSWKQKQLAVEQNPGRKASKEERRPCNADYRSIAER